MWTPEPTLRRLAALAVLAVGIIATIATDTPALRYASVGNSRACSARQVLGTPKEVDVLLFGTSRVRRGIAPEEVSGALPHDLADVFNLGRPGIGNRRPAIILRDLLEEGIRPKVVIVEIRVRNLRFRKNSRPLNLESDTGFLKWSDVPTAAVQWEMPYPARWIASGHSALVKLASGLELMLDGTLGEIDEAFKEPAPAVCFAPGPAKAHKRQDAEKAALLAAVLAKDAAHFSRYDDIGVDFTTNAGRSELTQIVALRELSKQYGFRLAVIQVPEYTQLPYSERAKAAVLEVVPEFRFPPDDFFRLDASFFFDTNHLYGEGRVMFSRWIAEVAAQEAARP